MREKTPGKEDDNRYLYQVKAKILAIHILLWLLYVLSYAVLWGDTNSSFTSNLLNEIGLLPFKLILVYTAILYLVPKLLFTKRHALFFVTIVLLVASTGILHHLYTHFIVAPALGSLRSSEELWNWARITKRMTYLNTPMLIAITLVVLDNFYQQKEINARITNEKLLAELKLLKNQLHPHFFFNTLNNLYSLALKKSDLTPILILKLAELMRYSLEKTEEEKVPLSEELQFIKNYIAIEEERFKDRVQVCWNIQETEGDKMVPPFLLNTFVENAFKHGVAKSRQKIVITIKLEASANQLVYSVFNQVVLPQQLTSIEDRSGFGLNNLKQRLRLLYPDNHYCATEMNQGFHAHLKIPLT